MEKFPPLHDPVRTGRFKDLVLTHLDAAKDLARWLTHDNFGAEEVVQDECMRAFRAFDSITGESPKAWFMTIIRHCSYNWLRVNKQLALEDVCDEESHGSNGTRAGCTHRKPKRREPPKHAAYAQPLRHCPPSIVK